jgi:chemotaxis protein MotB
MSSLPTQSGYDRDFTRPDSGPPADVALDPDLHGDRDGWLISYIDILTLLITLFVLMLAFNRVDNPDKQHQPASATSASTSDAGSAGDTTDTYTALREKTLTSPPAIATDEPIPSVMHPALRHLAKMDLPPGITREIDMAYSDKSIRLEIGNEVMFAPGDAALSLSGMGILNELAPLLFRHNYQVSVEGHTDSVPIHSRRYPSNWELSSARAASVIRFLVGTGINAERLRAVGYADTHPLVINPAPAAQAKNRRVSLVIHASD